MWPVVKSNVPSSNMSKFPVDTTEALDDEDEEMVGETWSGQQEMPCFGASEEESSKIFEFVVLVVVLDIVMEKTCGSSSGGVSVSVGVSVGVGV